jgi:hypothetical protein
MKIDEILTHILQLSIMLGFVGSVVQSIFLIVDTNKFPEPINKLLLGSGISSIIAILFVFVYLFTKNENHKKKLLILIILLMIIEFCFASFNYSKINKVLLSDSQKLSIEILFGWSILFIVSILFLGLYKYYNKN